MIQCYCAGGCGEAMQFGGILSDFPTSHPPPYCPARQSSLAQLTSPALQNRATPVLLDTCARFMCNFAHYPLVSMDNTARAHCLRGDTSTFPGALLRQLNSVEWGT